MSLIADDSNGKSHKAFFAQLSHRLIHHRQNDVGGLWARHAGLAPTSAN